MSTSDDLPAAEVYAIIQEPTSHMGPIRTLLHKVIAPFGGQLIPGGTHPVVVVRATGQKVKEAGTVLLDDMQEDLGKMSAREFHNRYIDL